MIRRFLLDSDVKMTKNAYYEMCEMLGNEPNPEEVPVDMDDFPALVQQIFVVYDILPDMWDTMGGNYMGKDYGIVFNLFNTYHFEPEEHLLALKFLQQMDRTRSKIVADKLKAKSKSPST